jgi:hypothetical protein
MGHREDYEIETTIEGTVFPHKHTTLMHTIFNTHSDFTHLVQQQREEILREAARRRHVIPFQFIAFLTLTIPLIHNTNTNTITHNHSYTATNIQTHTHNHAVRTNSNTNTNTHTTQATRTQIHVYYALHTPHT